MSWERQTSEALHSCAHPPAPVLRPPPVCVDAPGVHVHAVGLFAQAIVAPVMRVMARMDTQVL